MPGATDKSEPPSPHLITGLPQVPVESCAKSAEPGRTVLRQSSRPLHSLEGGVSIEVGLDEGTAVPAFAVSDSYSPVSLSTHTTNRDRLCRVIPTPERVRLRTRPTQEEHRCPKDW